MSLWGASAEQSSFVVDDELALAHYGLLSARRQALLFERTLVRELGPRLRQLDLLAPDDVVTAARS
jgi:hypothetical protein